MPAFEVLCHIHDTLSNICNQADSSLFRCSALTHSLSECISCIPPPGWEILGFLGCPLLDTSYILRHKQLQSKPCPRPPADVNKLCKTVPRRSGGCILYWGQKGPIDKLNKEPQKPNLSIRPLIIEIAGSSFPKRNSYVNRGNYVLDLRGITEVTGQCASRYGHPSCLRSCA